MWQVAISMGVRIQRDRIKRIYLSFPHPLYSLSLSFTHTYTHKCLYAQRYKFLQPLYILYKCKHTSFLLGLEKQRVRRCWASWSSGSLFPVLVCVWRQERAERAPSPSPRDYVCTSRVNTPQEVTQTEMYLFRVLGLGSQTSKWQQIQYLLRGQCLCLSGTFSGGDGYCLLT